MTKQEFDALFERCKALAVFTYVETIQYTNELLYSVLSEALNIQE